MLKVDTTCFIHVPDLSRQRILRPGKTVYAAEHEYVITLEDKELILEDDQAVLLYYEHRQEFMQQAGRVLELVLADDSNMIRIRTIGEAISAEQRQCYRVSTVISGLKAMFDQQQGCSLLDISASGFAVASSLPKRIGDIVPVRLFYDGWEFSGSAGVKNVQELSSGRFRYGMYGINDPHYAGTLPKGMGKISMAVQREQLRRMAGAQA